MKHRHVLDFDFSIYIECPNPSCKATIERTIKKRLVYWTNAKGDIIEHKVVQI